MGTNRLPVGGDPQAVKVVAVYKWAKDPEDAAVRADGSIDWRGAKMAPGEDDPAALTVALGLAAAAGGTVVGLTIGDGDATWALARGVEQTVSVGDAPSLLDNAATAAILAAAVREIGGVDVVAIGDAEAYPGVVPALAADLGWPALLGVSAASVVGERLEALRRVGDEQQSVSLCLPAVLGIAAASAEKQTPGMKEILAARRRPVTAMPLAGLAVTHNDELRSTATRLPETTAARLFQGDPETAASQLVATLRADGAL